VRSISPTSTSKANISACSFANIDENALLIIIFKAELSAGAIKYFAAETVRKIARQMQRAQTRAPGESVDLVSENSLDVSTVFTKKRQD